MKRSYSKICEQPRVKKRKRVCQRGDLIFYTIKSKLRTVIHSPEVLCKLGDVVLLAHEAFKRAMFFLRLFCLSTGLVPEMSVSTMRQCLNMVCSQGPS